MSAVLLMRIQAPLQSWGTQSNFTIRDTGREPSKSAIIGLICAAMGRSRQEPVDDLAGLKMGVRVDREGRLSWDYQIAQNVLQSNLGGKKDSIPSTRYYLADAVFLVGLEGETELLQKIHHALQHPKWQLFFGRKAFPPAQPIWLQDGIREGEELSEVLKTYPWLVHPDKTRNRPSTLRLILEDAHGLEARTDQPISFAERKFGQRRVNISLIPCPEKSIEEEPCTYPG